MGAPAKFLFGDDFAPPPAAAKAVPAAEHQAQVVEAEARGYGKGFAAAEAEAQAADARRLAQAMEKIAGDFGQVCAQLTQIEGRHAADAIDVAVTVARKLAPALIAREPLAEIEALVADTFRHLVAAPHIVVRVADAIYPQVNEKLSAIAHQLGFEGRLVILAEPEIGAGDCRIEWADGGVTRAREATESAIADIVERYLAGRRLAPQEFERQTS